MRFIVDESTGVAVVRYLRGQGHDVLAVDETMPQAKDVDILARAVAESRVLITNDKDFGELVFRLNRASVGVILLRLRDDNSASRVGTVKFVLESFGDRVMDHFVVATERAVRLRASMFPPRGPVSS